MAIVSSRDVQEIVEKLSSDKAKAREEGIKLLNSWLEGERSFNFCKFIGQSTGKLKPDEIPHSETWPFLISLLIQSASMEISSSKRKMPKIVFAKTLRVVVQRAEDAKYSGKMLPLLSVVKPLYNHVWDVLSNVPSFQSEYGIILRHLLAVKDYSFQMKKRIYCNLVLLFIEKVEASLKGNSISHYTSKDEAFRHIVTLHSLLENPPGDYPDNLREDTIKGFVRVCSFIRDEGKISRKLVECINTYLLNDGPNLGCQVSEIHNAMQQFVFRCWLTTHDRVLKDALMLYARLQLNLTRGAGDRCLLVEQLLDVICKDLDQGSTSNISISWGDGNKDDKFGALSSSQCVLVELAAVLFYKACHTTTIASLAEKRVKRESAAVLLREALTKGKWLWNAAFSYLTRNYHTRISKDLFLYWFEAIWMSFDRILNSANMERAYEGVLWTLRSLQELSFVLLLPNSKMEKLSMSLPSLNEFINGWQLIWSSVVHALPVYSNIIAVVDAALVLLGNIASNDLVNTCVIPQDVWDLQLFKRPPSMPMLYFFSCYFLRRKFQVDLRDILHLRKNLLRATFSHFTWKGTSMLNERMVLFLPTALYALCAGCAPFSQCFKEFPQLYSSLDVTEVLSDSRKVEDPKHQCLRDFLDCSVEVLTEIDVLSKVEVSELQRHPQVHLPREIKDQLLHEVETSICEALVEEEMKERSLPDIFFTCSLLSNLIHGSFFTRKINVSFLSKLSQYLLAILDYAVNFIQQDRNVHSLSCLGYDYTFEETGPVVGSVRSFLSSPIFKEWRDQNKLDLLPVSEIIHSVERLLKAFVQLYEDYSQRVVSLQSEMVLQDIGATDNVECSRPYDSNKTRIIDMELDVNDYSRDRDILTAGNNRSSGDSFSAQKWKMGMISLISSFFSVSHVITWDILFKLMENESDTKVQEKILYHLCQHPHWSSSAKFLKLINVMDEMIEVQVRLKLDCCNVLSAACCLLATLLSLDTVGRDKCGLCLRQMETEQCFLSLGNAIHKLVQFDLLDWFGRVKLIDCICNLILLNPQSGQTMIERLLLMLQDVDYRVRLFMARKIGVLFQTWDGHEELFHDICLNFGVPLVVYSKQKVITAKEVLAAGPQPQPAMETVLITLMHLALYSEKIELDAVFMMCVVSAIDPYHRELVRAIVNKLSNELQYTTRMKYLEQLLGSLIFRWVTCGVSLVALVETRHLFVPDAEPGHFLQYCCHWLLPALLLHENSTSDLNWVAKVTCQPLTVLVENYFASIFAVCMALHCGKKPGSEKGTLVLQSSILHFGQISENERDKLIKKHMVSIVSGMLSLSSCSSDPVVPFFLRDTVSRAVQTIVDGFLEMGDSHTSAGIVDKINIFRPDRVFMFMVEIHYRIAAAIHYRHKCHHLAGIEVLVGIIGHRAAIPSTSNYLFNLIGPLIGCDALQDQCCHIILALLIQLKRNLSTEITSVLGEQLQFLVSKLVACCNSEVKEQCGSTASSLILSLVHSLIVDSDPSMYDYIRELEPFPESEIFGEIRKFHEELCLAYSIRDHLLKFAKRSCYLPPRILLSGLQALHKKLLNVEALRRGGTLVNYIEDGDWHSDHEMVHAVWTLVRTCGSNEASGVRELVSDFISMVGAGDPHSVVFHLPEEAGRIDVGRSKNTNNVIENFEISVSEEVLIVLMKLLKKYLMDDSVKIVDMASQTLRGILSTERGQHTLDSLDSHQRSLIEVHSKGVNNELVENFLSDLERKSKVEAYSLEKSTVWVTQGKSFDMWICPLVYSLIVYCNDVILRLCQDISLLEAEIAELLLPCIFVNLAGRKDLDIDLQKLISLQLQEHIFTESNKSVKSIKVLLNCLNELRICHVLERSSFVPSKRESSKNSRPSSYSSKTRSTPAKARSSVVMSSGSANSASSWEKVYWLSLDYLLVAKSAVICGSYFTSLMYVEYWCEEHFKGMTLGGPDFSENESLPDHIEVLVSAVTSINEPDSLYGILQSHKLTSQIITFEHEGNWGKALEYCDLQVRSNISIQKDGRFRNILLERNQVSDPSSVATEEDDIRQRKPYKGLVRSLQQIGCSHVLELYCQGLTSKEDQLQHDLEFAELQYEAAWRAGNWDFSLPCIGGNSPLLSQDIKCDHFNENLHSCLKALREGDLSDFCRKLKDSKQELAWSVSHTSEESPEYIYLAIIKLQILHHLGMAWDLRWMSKHRSSKFCLEEPNVSLEPLIPSIEQLSRLNMDWFLIVERAQLHMNLLEPFIAFRRVLLQILSCRDWTLQHLLQSASILRKGSRFSHAAAALHEFKFLSVETEGQHSSLYWLGRLEEAKFLRAQGQHEMAISLAEYILQNYKSNDEDASDVYRLIGKWLAETRSSNSRTILEKYLKPAVSIAEGVNTTNKKAIKRQCQTRFHLAHYADALFRSHEERLNSNEWQAAMRLRKHKTVELEALLRRLRSSTKGEKTDYTLKIQELQKQVAMDMEEAQKLQDDRDNFLSLALEGYKRCLVIGDKYDVRVVFRLVSLWFSLSSRKDVVNSMLSTIDEVQSFKFIPLVYQIASRMGSSKDVQGTCNFQHALVSLVKKMAIDHPYHTILQLLALANGDRIKDKQRSRNSFVVDMEKKLAAENLLKELSSCHGAIIRQMKQMVEIYIKLAELETRREDTNKRMTLPRELRSTPTLELVPVVTATVPIDHNCQYKEGTFAYFKGLADSVMIMNGINAPKVVECLGSDGCRYRQLAKSGNDDLRQDAVMEQFFGLVNTFLRNHRDTWKRRLGVRTYKVVPFTPSAGVLEWVNGTLPLGEYLIGSMRNGGAHGRYGMGDWPFLKCREYLSNERDKRRAFLEVCKNFRPVMHYFFLERFLQPADWFKKRLAYTRSVAASSMVGYIVGLGDRHSMNILIDQATAEVVHIDLGVAFEQGLMLKTPERVPFRLTRDVIDGMGVTGVEGVFRRCCEETLSVMRTNKEALLTIIEVFIHDPLYKWALSPLKALQRQKETDDDLDTSLEEAQNDYEGNKDAARALLRVKQKLDGYEEGEMRSVHGQVQQLIQDAIDPERLCQLFPGWGAWL
ncbi:hypothetical protein L6164_014710 [Bauhinia variegata]|uniref:Uncharacterized protein n=1 Tax=Bauhinia variegata TaxID=167791 RepID=A0ACB9NIG3_BAUVA|nr:hypothetical protein L6164_014710 [Bauhinia variegata]